MTAASRAQRVASPTAPADRLPFPQSQGELAVRLLSKTREAGQDGLILVAAKETRTESLARILWALAPDIRTLIFPPWDCMPYDRVRPSGRTMGLRVTALAELATGIGQPWILLTTPEGLIQRVPARSLWEGATLHLRRGEPIDLDGLRSELGRIGYWEDDRVDETGEFAIRGQVVDIYPAGYFLPVRLEHAEGVITSIASFEPATQLRTDDFETLDVRPVSEAVISESSPPVQGPIEHRLPELYPDLESLLDYAPRATLAFEPRAQDRLQAFREQIRDGYDSRHRIGTSLPRPLAPERLYMGEKEWHAALAGRRELNLTAADESEAEAVPHFAQAERPSRSLATFLAERKTAGYRVLATAGSEAELRAATRLVARAAKLTPERAGSWEEVRRAAPGAILSMAVDVDHSFMVSEDEVAVLAATDLLGSRTRVSAQSEAANPLAAEEEFHLSDAVIHLQHGVGRLQGIETLGPDAATATDMIRLEYAGDAKLMVPVSDIDLMWRYGPAPGVALDRLDGESWPKRRAKVEAEINAAAVELARIAAERRATERAPIVPPSGAYERFVARFPFTDTPDQASAVADVLRDLASGHVMNRLVCGDVGFGKTEVALRAAAAVALSGRQVAVVAPTTVLVRQHLQTFERRFAEFGIEVEHLSRLVSPAEAKRVKAGAADGSAKVVVGTHALAGNGVSFAELGLLIIDEEQRFGAAHKERLRALGEDVHVLTLTATPIPRTLQSALVGLQDVSVLATPPAERQPVRTFVVEFDEVTIREALLREKRRGGQSFLVCPRIEDIEPMAARLRSLVPELEISIAHGRLPADEIDRTMVGFADGEGDLLLATNIIESGLDVPRANTILVWRADLFGLSQLHQLRGRVGRGRARGYAYLMTEPGAEITEETRKRLGTLERLDRLGSGFAISAEDLDQRGAGDLLGDTQAGHVKLIGAGLYRRLLERALAAARGEEPPEEWTPELNLEVAGRIPDEYVPEPEVRINLYARMARCQDEASEEHLAEEIKDRFGALPEEVRGVLALNRLRRHCREAGVARVDAGPQAIALTFKDRQSENPALQSTVAEDGRLAWRGERLVCAEATTDPHERLAAVEMLLEALR